MSVSRRSIFTGGAALSALGLIGLAGCSTAADSTSSANQSTAPSAGGAPQQKILWTWPDGFGKETLAAVASKFPQYKVRQDVIGGDFKQKLTTTFSAKSGLPDITGIKGEDIAFFKSQPDFFVDLNSLGAGDLKDQYLDWKWQQGTTPDGKMIGFPIDIGPTALFYRTDTFEKAGLPTDPDEVADAIKTWDEYFELGKELISKLPDTFLVRNASGIFGIAWQQTGQGFVDENDTFIGDQDHIKSAWDIAVKTKTMGIDGNIQSNTPDSQAAVNQGKLPADIGASWHLADLMSDAPSTSGKWHVARHPGNAINNGGSFLGIPEGVADPKASMEIITFLLNADNQALEFADKGNFPSTPASFTMPQLTQPVDFLGGQVAGELFGDAAKNVKAIYEHPQNGTVNAPFYSEMELFENGKKSADQAWNDAVTAAQRVAKQAGLQVK